MRAVPRVEEREELAHGCQNKGGERAEEESLPVLVVGGKRRRLARVCPAHELLNLAQVRRDAAVPVGQIIDDLQAGFQMV